MAQPSPTNPPPAALPAGKAPAKDAPVSRAVDLGREEELVTWSEWFARAMGHMAEVVPPEKREQLQFRVTLHDGRWYWVRQVLTHVVRGRCSLEPSRWEGMGAVCDVITGYMLLGEDEQGHFVAASVPPAEIATVECVLTREEEKAPFGFHKKELMSIPAGQKEIEEPGGSRAEEIVKTKKKRKK